MTPATDPKYAACRRGMHTPDPGSVIVQGFAVVACCSVCGAELTVLRPEWVAVYDDVTRCTACGEGAPFCTCEGGPMGGDA